MTHAIRVHEYGGPDVLKWEEVEVGAPGPGEWITIYTNYGHIFMVVGGLRFDTSGQGRAGTRWQDEPRSTAGFAMRHIPGL